MTSQKWRFLKVDKQQISSFLKGRRLLILDTLLLGVVGALSAQLFNWLLNLAQDIFLKRLAGYQPAGLPNEGGSLQPVMGTHGLWLVPVATTLGGLIVGFLVYTFAPEAEGHGTDAVVKAYHRAGGIIRGRIPPLKMIASAITIGSGATAGREGPTALVSAGIGSVYASLTNRSEEEHRLLVLIGMASGLSAIFRSPIGASLFVVEVLYGGMEFEPVALLYTMLGSVIAFAVNGLFVGYEPLFQIPPTLPLSFFDYFWYIILGVAAGFIASLLPMVFYGLRDIFRGIHIPPHFKPAIGGLAAGLLALAFPQIIGGGYAYIQQAINGEMSAGLMFLLMFCEMLAFSFTISSGGSGGVFAPSLFVGTMLGGFLAKVFGLPSASLAVVGMAAVFGGAARVPVATMFMVLEMTGDYSLLVPAALSIMLSYLVQTELSTRLKYKSLYEAQVAARWESPAHYINHLDAVLRILREQPFSVPPTITHVDLRTLLASGIPVDLPGGEHLVIGVLRSDSPLVGRSIRESFSANGINNVTLAAIFREGNTLLPRGDLVLNTNDRLLAVASVDGVSQLSQHVNPLKRSDVILNQGSKSLL